MGIIYKEDPIAYNLKVIDKLDSASTASLQKDIARGHESEIQGQLFDMIELGEKLGVEMLLSQGGTKIRNNAPEPVIKGLPISLSVFS